MDAKAGIKADQRQERLKATDKNELGAAAAGMGNRRCVPGLRATSFGASHASDEHLLARVLRDRASEEVATVSLGASGTAVLVPLAADLAPPAAESAPPAANPAPRLPQSLFPLSGMSSAAK